MEYNIKIHLEFGVNCIQLAQDRVQLLAILNTLLNLQDLLKADFLTTLAVVRF
jgi:hypothetical protein